MIKMEKLIKKLESKFKVTLDDLTSESNNSIIDEDTINIFDEELHDFMKDEFCDDYESDDEASEFYQQHACDIRNDFEDRLIFWITENRNVLERIEL